MNRTNRSLLLRLAVALAVPVAVHAADGKAAPARLTADQIVARHVEARGGKAAWQGVQSMQWSGRMDVGGADSTARSARFMKATARKGKAARATPVEGNDGGATAVEVPFLLEAKRPDRSRIEIEFAGKRAVQVFDGSRGWLLRPFLNREDWEPFSDEQARAYRGKGAFDDPLLDAAAGGVRVRLVSTEKVDGRDAYKLELERPGREALHVWIDARTFLDVKVEGTPRRMDGKMRTVWVTQRDFRPVGGVVLPFVLETSVDGYPDTHRIVVEKVELNPVIDDARFSRPRT